MKKAEEEKQACEDSDSDDSLHVEDLDDLESE